MNWITVIWSIAAGVSLTLGAVHLLVWFRQRETLEHLFFWVSAMAAAAIALQELALMHAQTPDQYAATLRWMHVSAATITIALVWFIRAHLGAGRNWLAWLVTGLRLVVLVQNFFLFPTPTFLAIESLREIHFLGEALSAPVGDPGPWRVLVHLSTVLLLAFTLDASLSAWRQGRARQALVTGSSILLGVVLAATFSHLMVRGILPSPLIGLVYLLLVSAMAFELSMDVLQSKQLSRKLLASEERMRHAARAADLGLWEWNVADDQFWANDVGRRRTGTGEGEKVGLDRYLALIHPDDRDSFRRTLDRALEAGEDVDLEFRMTGADGVERWLSAWGGVERDAQGHALRVRGVSMDVTARRQVELQFQQHRNELALVQRVSAMGQLSAALTHELNQPLGAILRNAEAGEMFFNRTPPSLDELPSILVDIQNDARRAADVIDRMRSLMQHGSLRFEAIEVQELVEQVAALLKIELQARHTSLRIVLPHGLPKVRGDRVHLQQVILNLMLNSLEAMADAKAMRREIEVRADPTPDDRVELLVKDTGPGFDPERLPTLFKPFITTKAGGTGLGLSICRTIVEAHEGYLRAENSPDGGACMRIGLPAAPDEAAA